MGSQQLFDMRNLAHCRVNLAICESALAAMKKVTTMPDSSGVVAVHNDAMVEAYYELQTAEHHAESGFGAGTVDEWQALSAKDKTSEWERFHSLCTDGIGDQMYFYRVLMDQFLVGYAGH